MHDNYNEWLNYLMTKNDVVTKLYVNKPATINNGYNYNISVVDEEITTGYEPSGWLKACILGEFEDEGCIESVDPEEFENILNGG